MMNDHVVREKNPFQCAKIKYGIKKPCFTAKMKQGFFMQKRKFPVRDKEVLHTLRVSGTMGLQLGINPRTG